MKILYLMRILLEETDKDHILNATELCDRLRSRYDLTCSRKTIYSDVLKLRSFGIDIIQVRGNVSGYYVKERDFSLPELKLLVDAVQSSKFITTKKSESLIKKLERMTSRANASQLQREVFIINRPKSINETIYENVDLIHAAISGNRQIRCQYCEWTVEKKLVPRRDGKIYELSPWSFTWDDENYYLVGYDESSGKIKHYRVDKMKNMELSEKDRSGREEFKDFDLAAFAKRTFGMYGGEERNVTLLCINKLAGVVLDRFGRDIMIVKADEEHFRTHVPVSVSSQFFGWVTGIGPGMQILEPEDVREEYRRYLSNILGSYQE